MNRPIIHIIVAAAANGAIGRNGDLLYHIPDDLRHFKQLTMGHPIIMGRKTFESFPKGPLPGRRNIVITRQTDYHPAGAESVDSLQGAIDLCSNSNDIFIIGGGQIYAQALPLARFLHITEIYDSPADADTFFPPHNGTLLDATSPVDPTTSTPAYRFATYQL